MKMDNKENQPQNAEKNNEPEDSPQAKPVLTKRQQNILLGMMLAVIAFLLYLSYLKHSPAQDNQPKQKSEFKAAITYQRDLLDAWRDGNDLIANSSNAENGFLTFLTTTGELKKSFKFDAPIPQIKKITSSKYAVGTVFGDVYLADLNKEKPEKIFSFENGMVTCLDVMGENDILVGNLDGKIVQWDIANSKQVKIWQTPAGNSAKFCRVFNNRELMVIDNVGQVFAGNLIDGQPNLKALKKLGGVDSQITEAKLTADNRLWIILDDTLKCFTLPNFNEVFSKGLQTDFAPSDQSKENADYLGFEISADGNFAAVYSEVYVAVYSLATGQKIFDKQSQIAVLKFESNAKLWTVTRQGFIVEIPLTESLSKTPE